MLNVRDHIGRFTWTATDESGELYVVRKIDQDRLEFFSYLMQLRSELEFMPRIHYVGHDSGSGFCIIEEFINGRTLRELQNQYKDQQDKVSSLLVRLGSYLYSLRLYNIVHGDIKPENIMISTAGRMDRIYLIDFEFSQRVDDSGRAPCLGYTPLYCSAQMIDGHVCHDIDVRALGITMLELLQGRHPFYQDVMGDPEEIARIVAESQVESASGDIFDLIARMCQVNPVGT
ncbi:protein kinase [Candidatus Poribacteria bacterium]